MNITAYDRIDDIMRDADLAMYRAKKDGGKEFRVSADFAPAGVSS